MNHFTTEDMIRFLYNEMNPEETRMVTEALASDWLLKEKYETLKASMNDLDTVRFSPRLSSIESILQYAEQEAEVRS
jgi:hypothetical protein